MLFFCINEGSQNYYKLLDALKEHLKDYVLTVDTKKYDTKENPTHGVTLFVVVL